MDNRYITVSTGRTLRLWCSDPAVTGASALLVTTGEGEVLLEVPDALEAAPVVPGSAVGLRANRVEPLDGHVARIVFPVSYAVLITYSPTPSTLLRALESL